MHILIVEDNKDFSVALIALMRHLREIYPGVTIEVICDLPAALDRICKEPKFEMIFLDLVLPPFSMMDTLKELDKFENSGPVAIITGHHPEKVKEMMGKREKGTEVIYKPDIVERGSAFLYGIMRRVTMAFHGRRFAEQYERLKKLDDLITELHASP